MIAKQHVMDGPLATLATYLIERKATSFSPEPQAVRCRNKTSRFIIQCVP